MQNEIADMLLPESSLLNEDSCWDAVARRDASAAGAFCFGVLTTGVYCRTSCSARLPKRENVRFYASWQEAEQAGFRACKRCKPRQAESTSSGSGSILTICRMIEAAEETPSLDTLAEAVGISPFHLQRTFKAHTGVSPKGYANALRLKRLRQSLSSRQTITEAAYEAGFNSSGHFYAASSGLLGMTPKQYRTGGAGVPMYFALGECWLGSFLVAATDKGIAAITLGDEPGRLLCALQDQFPRAELIGGDASFESVVATLISALEEPEKSARLPLDIRGTAFQQRVWQALLNIRPGCTLSYSELAASIGKPSAYRAVARACASNRLAVAIPCHRVVRNDGSLSGYRWGLERKQALLQREAARTNPVSAEAKEDGARDVQECDGR